MRISNMMKAESEVRTLRKVVHEENGNVHVLINIWYFDENSIS